MQDSLTLQPIARVNGTVNLPGSKSVSNRALLLAALAKGKTRLTNLLDSDDVKHMLNALKALDVDFTLSHDRTVCEVTGKGGPLWLHNRLSFSWAMLARPCARWQRRSALGRRMWCSRASRE